VTHKLHTFPGDVALTFLGELLGSGTSHKPGRAHWSEVSVYRTPGASYVAVVSGKSRRPGETTYWRMLVFRGAEPLVTALSRPLPGGPGKALPQYARDALSAAAARDSDISCALGRPGAPC
jgi:hypothetical protein